MTFSANEDALLAFRDVVLFSVVPDGTLVQLATLPPVNWRATLIRSLRDRSVTAADCQWGVWKKTCRNNEPWRCPCFQYFKTQVPETGIFQA